jgi:hypothetical protein
MKRQQKNRESLDFIGLSRSLAATYDTLQKWLMVARDGIEPPTRGFSIRCSTN